MLESSGSAPACRSRAHFSRIRPTLKSTMRNPVHSHRALSRWATPALCAAVLLAGCAVSRQHTEGLEAMAAGNREKGLAQLEAASAAEPTNSQYRLDYLKQFSLTLNPLLAQADDARPARQ